MIYPDDDHGIVLRRIAAQGKDLTKARNVDFTVIFAHSSSAEQFAEHFRKRGYAVSVRETATEEDFPWDVIVVKHMVPTYEGITDFESLLQSIAGRWNGHNDGWGLFLRTDCKLTIAANSRDPFNKRVGHPYSVCWLTFSSTPTLPSITNRLDPHRR